MVNRAFSPRNPKDNFAMQRGIRESRKGKLGDSRPEVVIVGAGPAGLATAIAPVEGIPTVYGRPKPPIDKTAAKDFSRTARQR